MTKQPQATARTAENGNIFLYLLIAITLFASLTFIMTRSQDTSETSVLSEAQIDTATERLIAYINQIQQVWLQMEDTGTDLTELDPMLPDDPDFNTPPHLHKLFHPEGGGLTYTSMNEDSFRAAATTPVGWHFTKVNLDWTTDPADNLIVTYVRLKQSLCADINLKLTGSATIPVVSVNYQNTFVDGSSALQETDCASCKEYRAICVNNGGVYAFYNLIDSR